MKKVNQHLLSALVACANVMENTMDDFNGCPISETASEEYSNAIEAIDEANELLEKINLEIKSKSYTLRGENGEWLGQIVLTSDGMFASVTDYGNLSYAWRSFGDDFRDFMIHINTGYFGSKLYTGMAYILFGKKCEQACQRFAEKILPPLQKALREEVERG